MRLSEMAKVSRFVGPILQFNGNHALIWMQKNGSFRVAIGEWIETGLLRALSPNNFHPSRDGISALRTNQNNISH
jgi:hypothetical protein